MPYTLNIPAPRILFDNSSDASGYTISSPQTGWGSDAVFFGDMTYRLLESVEADPRSIIHVSGSLRSSNTTRFFSFEIPGSLWISMPYKLPTDNDNDGTWTTYIQRNNVTIVTTFGEMGLTLRKETHSTDPNLDAFRLAFATNNGAAISQGRIRFEQVFSMQDISLEGTDETGSGGFTGVVSDGSLIGNGTQLSPLRVANVFSIADEGKLDSVEFGANVNVQPDWNQTDDTLDSFILNKPPSGIGALNTFLFNGARESVLAAGTDWAVPLSRAPLDNSLLIIFVIDQGGGSANNFRFSNIVGGRPFNLLPLRGSERIVFSNPRMGNQDVTSTNAAAAITAIGRTTASEMSFRSSHSNLWGNFRLSILELSFPEGSDMGEILSTIFSDETLTGSGTQTSPLSVALPYTQVEKDKLSGIEMGATAPIIPDWNAGILDDGFIQNKPTIPDPREAGTGLQLVGNRLVVLNPFLDSHEQKLDSIETGAERNVNANWDESNSANDSFIFNKPTIPVPRGAGSGLALSGNDLVVINPFRQPDEDKLNALPSISSIGSGLNLDSNGILTAPGGMGGGGIISIVSDSSLSGEGTTANPLSVSNEFTLSEKQKLQGIEIDAEANVQPNWEETDPSSDSFINNKPNIEPPRSDSDIQSIVGSMAGDNLEYDSSNQRINAESGGGTLTLQSFLDLVMGNPQQNQAVRYDENTNSLRWGEAILSMNEISPKGFTVEQYNSIIEAFASGSTSVSYSGKAIQYRSLDDMARIIQIMEVSLGLRPSSSGRRTDRLIYRNPRRGDNR